MARKDAGQLFDERHQRVPPVEDVRLQVIRWVLASAGWPSIFYVNVPLGIVALVLTQRYLPADLRKPNADRASFDVVSTLLALTLAAHALAMTIGRGRFGLLNVVLLAAALVGVALAVAIGTGRNMRLIGHDVRV